MRKRIKYAIIYSIVGIFVGYIVYGIAFVLAWLFILGDGPTSPMQGIIAVFFSYGLVISSWLFTVYLGYRQGIEAESHIDTVENSQENAQFIKKAIFKVILTIVVAAIILFSFAFWSISNEKSPQTSNEVIKNTMTTGSVNTDQKKFDVMNFMELARGNAYICVENSGGVFPGKSGDKMCGNSNVYIWPQIKSCGANPENTTWVVTNGQTKNWSIEVYCTDASYCSGKANAFCNSDGCVFSKNCDPRKK